MAAMAMLMRADPFQQIDRIFQQMTGTLARPAVMPMDAWRSGNEFLVQFDLPGVDPASIDVTVERNELTVRAERRRPEAEGAELVINERPMGVFTRQMFLGESLDIERLEARYDDGVLSIRIPVAEQAKPRKIEIASGERGSRRVTSEATRQ
jgi:HSP20 family protein